MALNRVLLGLLLIFWGNSALSAASLSIEAVSLEFHEAVSGEIPDDSSPTTPFCPVPCEDEDRDEEEEDDGAAEADGLFECSPAPPLRAFDPASRLENEGSPTLGRPPKSLTL